ncbi:MAG TPA: hypothetical protein VJ793_04055 [Anaerolineae bacterium]|nr:hypothetical protein [Anaerolineae bacterium]
MSVTAYHAEARLREWETRLRERLPGITLLVELGLSRTDCVDIGECIRTIVAIDGQAPAIRRIQSRYPLAFAAFLAAEASYFYTAGDYWSDVVRRTGIAHQTCVNQVGPAFETILKELGLPTFAQLEFEAATKYVSKFLAHGGIPDYSLNDFFEHLLMRALLRPDWAGMSTAELIEEWRALPSAFVSIDKPVRRFLLYGGRVAEDFLSRCKQMAERALDERTVPPAEELHLPPHVIESFTRWFEEWVKREGRRLSRRQQTHAVYRKPLVTYAPWDGAILVELPSQTLLRVPSVASQWSIAGGVATRTISLALHPRGGLLESDSKTFFLDRPAQAYEFSLVVNGESVRTWHFPGTSKDQPLLAFEPDSARIIIWRDALPAKPLWLVLPEGYILTATRRGEKSAEPVPIIEEFPPLGRGWERYRGLHVDLPGFAILFLSGSNNRVPVPLQRPDETERYPELIDGHELWPFPAAPTPLQVYSSSPPRLRFPLVEGQSPEDVLARTTLTIDANGESSTVPLRYLEFERSPDNRALIFALDQVGFLGPNPIGDFRLILRGALGQAATFNLRILPQISLAGHDDLLVPNSQGIVPPAQFSVRVPEHVRMEVETSTAVTLTGPRQLDDTGENEYHLNAAPEVNSISVSVVTPDQIRLPFLIPVRRLRWAVIGLNDGPTSLDWQMSPLQLDRESLERAPDPELVVGVPVNLDEQIELKCTLYEEGWQKLQESVSSQSGGRTRFRRFPLKKFLDTVRQSDAADLTFIIEGELRAPNRPLQTVFVPAVRLTQQYVVSDVALDAELRDETRTILVSWHQPYRVHDRILRFWPLWRPWAAPCEIALPDDVREEYIFDVPAANLPPGAYRLEFATRGRWTNAPQSVRCPPASSPNTAEITPGDSDEFQRYWTALPQGPLRRLESVLAFGHGRELAALADEYAPEHAPQLLEALLALTAYKDKHFSGVSEADIQALGITLLRYPSSFLQALASRIREADRTSVRQLLILQNVLDQPIDWSTSADVLADSEREALWNLWPPLGLFADSARLQRADERAMLRAFRCLGRYGSGLLSPRFLADGNDNEATSDNVWNDTRFFGPRLNQLEIEISLEQLKQIRGNLDLLPQSLLDIDSWVLANLEWVEWMKSAPDRTHRVTSFLRRTLAAADAALSDLAAAMTSNPQLVDLLRQRESDDGPGLLCNLPFVVGITILVLRLNAHGVEATHRLAVPLSGWRQTAYDLYAFAPSLCTHDVCLIELLLLANELVSSPSLNLTGG